MSSVTPVQSKIPASSDQEIFNIVEFKGLNCIENPFSASPGSATDSKNLYLNDEGTLATRPRVHFEQTFPAGYNVKKVINVTKIDDNETFYRILNTSDEYVNLLRIDNEGIFWHIINDTPEIKRSKENFTVFINDEGVLFYVCEGGLFYLNLYTFFNAYNSDKAYIPTTKIGVKLNADNVSEDLESYNLLSSKEKWQYYFDYNTKFNSSESKWDWDFSKIISSGYKNIPEIKYPYTIVRPLCRNTKNDQLIICGNGYDNEGHITYGGRPEDVKLKLVKSDGQIIDYETVLQNENILDHIGDYILNPNRCILSDDCNILFIYDDLTLRDSSLYSRVNIFDFNRRQWYMSEGSENIPIESSDTNRKWFFNIIPYKENSDSAIFSVWYRTSAGVFKVYMSLGSFYYTDNGTPMHNYSLKLKNELTNVYDINLLKYSNIAYDEKTDDIWLGVYTKYYNDSTINDYTAMWYNIGANETITYKMKMIIQSSSLNNFNYCYLQKSNNKCLYFKLKDNYLIYDAENDERKYLNDYILLQNWIYCYYIKGTDSLLIISANFNTLKATVWLWNNIKNSLSYPVEVLNDINLYLNKEYYKLYSLSETAIIDLYPTSGIVTINDDPLRFIYCDKDEKINSRKIIINTTAFKAPNLILTKDNGKSKTPISFSAHIIFDNKVFLYMGKEKNKENRVRWSKDMSAWYWPEKSAIDISDSEPITSMVQVSNSNLAIFKEKSALILSETEDIADDYIAVNLKTSLGNIPKKQAIVSSYSNLPMVINENGIQALKQTENVVTGDDIFVSLSDLIAPKLNILKDKQNIKTHNHRYWTYFYYDKYIWVLDNRTLDWYYWELPMSIDYMREEVFIADNVDESITMIWSGDKKYSLTTTTYFKENNDDKDLAEDIITYQDYLGDGLFNRIEWRWKTPPLYLNTINYIKKLVSVSLIFADRDRELYYDVVNNKYTVTSDDSVDNLQLLYTFKAYRKKSKFLNSEFSGQMDYVKNLKIKPRLQKFDFVELELTNKRTDSWGNNIWTYEDYMTNNDEPSTYGGKILDKLNLIGIAFRFTVSEGA